MGVSRNFPVPYHAAEGAALDGAAACQMILDRIGAAISQDTLNGTIQSNNVEPSLWQADPQGMERALNFHKPAAFQNYFVNFVHSTALEGSEKITYTLHRYQVATATLVFWGGMWVVVKGVQTDVDPLAGNTYAIQGFWIHNPWEPAGGSAGEYVTYSPPWLNTYFTPVSVQSPGPGLASQWNGKFISVCDPEPPKLGRQALPPPLLAARGAELLESGAAAELAQTLVKEHNLAEEDTFRRALDGTVPGAPHLVHRLDALHSFDYLVPFQHGAATRVLLRLDARFGYLQQAASFPDGVAFPSLSSADLCRRLAHGRLEITEWIGVPGRLNACVMDEYPIFRGMFCLYPALVWLACWESRSPLFPFYLLTVGAECFYVSSHNGAVYRRLHPFGPAGLGRPGGV